ncbi:MAG: efflux RND transporter periplasmic adaptor subunit [Bacteroidales bacterium]|nr:efflux RND transporter periplasmic adaptor subunit [Bacteroidales bacterium]MDD4217986.1 efflux RND transporter periplasmic adaptor subunit [Bacteroidales bacterium]MDY0142910.1 efflux RND transporter periplasmic adaptor subunit [Bacteroidales bacterium]
MKTKNLFLIGILSVSFMVLVSCGADSKARKSESEKESVKTVKIAKISEKEIGREIDYSANLLANEEVYLAPATPGRIIKIYPEVGDRVSVGQVLIQMDPTQLNTSKLQLQSLEKDMARLDTLIQYGGVSQQQYDQMKTQLEVTRSNIELLQTNIVMTAPFSGIVTAKYFENGELYSGAPNTQVGKAAILILQQINPIKAIINVSEKYYPVIKQGLEVNLVSDIYPNEVFTGKISLVHPTINAATKTFNVEIQIPNNKQLLRPGMYARVNLEFAKETAVVVPAIAVLQQIGTNRRYVFIHKNGIANKIDVEVGKRFDDQIEIISNNTNLGDELIVSGHGNLVDGAKVSVVE